MRTRLDKYIDDNGEYTPKRVRKNKQLYEDIKTSDLSDFKIESNAKVIGDNDREINIDKIKELLEKNYQSTPKRRTIELSNIEDESYELEKTREYDINAILEKAREEKKVNYQEERLKKVRNTQYDILKDLDISDTNKAAKSKTKEELLELINTINLNEYQKNDLEKEEKDMDPLDILSDLKGNEDTIVVGANDFNDETKRLEEVKEESKESKETINEIVKDIKTEKMNEEKIDTSFYTTSMTFDKDDFADFDDIDEGNRLGNFVIKLLVVLIFLAIIAGVVIFLNDFLKLGWF